jgi:aminocyclitol acetyltransferase
MYGRTRWHLAQARDREIVIWGTGRDVRVSDHMRSFRPSPSFYVSKEYKELRSFNGLPVKSKEVLRPEKHYVLIGSSLYSEGIAAEELCQSGFKEGVDFYNCMAVVLPYRIKAGSHLDIPLGRNTYYSRNESVYDTFVSEIGSFTSISHTAQFVDDHSLSRLSTANLTGISPEYFPNPASNAATAGGKYKIKIGNDVWIGANAVVNASRVKIIGDGAIIGTGAVVLEDVPPFAVMVGIPARVKKYRFSEREIEILLKVKWWDWDDKTLAENTELIENPRAFFERFGA